MTSLQKLLRGLGIEIDFEQVTKFIVDLQANLPGFIQRAVGALESGDARLARIERELQAQRLMLLALLEGREITPELAAALKGEHDGRTESTAIARSN